MNSSFDLLLSLAVLCALASVPLFVRQHCQTTTSTNQLLSKEEEEKDGESSAFSSTLYHCLHEPYRSYPCLPRRIHLGQASNVNSHHGVVSMTVSFSLDKHHCKHVTPYVYYKEKSKHNGKLSTEHSHSAAKATASPIHFNYTSSVTGEYFESDWIYHVVLPNLTSNSLYKYRIDVMIQEEQAMREVGLMNDASGTSAMRAMSTRRSSSLRSARRSRRLQLLAQPLHTSVMSTDDEADLLYSRTPDMYFATPPPPNAPTTIALVGDLGQTYDSTRTMQHIYRATRTTQQQHYSNNSIHNKHAVGAAPVTLVHIVGDMSYADSAPHRWTRWFDLMEPLLQQTPMTVAPGNHEIECDKVTHLPWVQYEDYFRNPNRMEPAQIEPIPQEYRNKLQDCSTPSVYQGDYNFGNSFYTFQHGLMTMIVLNSYTRSHVGSIQYKWLESQLQRHYHGRRQQRHHGDDTATDAPWLVVSFHSPIYNTFRDHVNETQALEMQQAMEPVFIKYKVNLVISGHCHAYMRSHPVAFGKRVMHNHKHTAVAPLYIIVGAGGNREGHSSGYQHDHPEEWVAKRDVEEFGYGHLYLANATHARWSWVRDDNDGSDGIRDHVWIVNRHVSSSSSSAR